jgi:predicted DNA-binding protein (UPF0251 family)
MDRTSFWKVWMSALPITAFTGGASVTFYDNSSLARQVHKVAFGIDAKIANAADAVNRAVERLPEDLRTAVVLRELEGLSYEEIAETMNCPIGTVRSRIFRAREAIAKVFHAKGWKARIATVMGDSVTERIDELRAAGEPLAHLDTGADISSVR